MPENIVVAIIAFGGTLVGTFGGIVASSRLTSYRIEQLEKKVDKHNEIIERTFRLEEKMEAANNRLDCLEREVKK